MFFKRQVDKTIKYLGNDDKSSLFCGNDNLVAKLCALGKSDFLEIYFFGEVNFDGDCGLKFCRANINLSIASRGVVDEFFRFINLDKNRVEALSNMEENKIRRELNVCRDETTFLVQADKKIDYIIDFNYKKHSKSESADIFEDEFLQYKIATNGQIKVCDKGIILSDVTGVKIEIIIKKATLSQKNSPKNIKNCANENDLYKEICSCGKIKDFMPKIDFGLKRDNVSITEKFFYLKRGFNSAEFVKNIYDYSLFCLNFVPFLLKVNCFFYSRSDENRYNEESNFFNSFIESQIMLRGLILYGGKFDFVKNYLKILVKHFENTDKKLNFESEPKKTEIKPNKKLKNKDIGNFCDNNIQKNMQKAGVLSEKSQKNNEFTENLNKMGQETDKLSITEIDREQIINRNLKCDYKMGVLSEKSQEKGKFTADLSKNDQKTGKITADLSKNDQDSCEFIVNLGNNGNLNGDFMGILGKKNKKIAGVDIRLESDFENRCFVIFNIYEYFLKTKDYDFLMKCKDFLFATCSAIEEIIKTANKSSIFALSKAIIEICVKVCDDFRHFDPKNSEIFNEWERLKKIVLPSFEVGEDGAIKQMIKNDKNTYFCDILHLFPYNFGAKTGANRDFEDIVANSCKKNYLKFEHDAFGLLDIILTLATCGDKDNACRLLDRFLKVFLSENLTFESSDCANSGFGKFGQNREINFCLNVMFVITFFNLFYNIYDKKLYLNDPFNLKIDKLKIFNIRLENSMVNLIFVKKRRLIKAIIVAKNGGKFEISLPKGVKNIKLRGEYEIEGDILHLEVEKGKKKKVKIYI